jgi:hypothetical protein
VLTLMTVNGTPAERFIHRNDLSSYLEVRRSRRSDRFGPDRKGPQR